MKTKAAKRYTHSIFKFILPLLLVYASTSAQAAASFNYGLSASCGYKDAPGPTGYVVRGSLTVFKKSLASPRGAITEANTRLGTYLIQPARVFELRSQAQTFCDAIQNLVFGSGTFKFVKRQVVRTGNPYVTDAIYNIDNLVVATKKLPGGAVQLLSLSRFAGTFTNRISQRYEAESNRYFTTGTVIYGRNILSRNINLR